MLLFKQQMRKRTVKHNFLLLHNIFVITALLHEKNMNIYVSFTVQKWMQRSIESEKFHMYIKGALAEAILFFPERKCSLLVRQVKKDTFIKVKQLDYLLAEFLADKKC